MCLQDASGSVPTCPQGCSPWLRVQVPPARGAAVSDTESQPVLREAEGSANASLTCHTPAQPRGGPAAPQVLREQLLTKLTAVTAHNREERNKTSIFLPFSIFIV